MNLLALVVTTALAVIVGAAPPLVADGSLSTTIATVLDIPTLTDLDHGQIKLLNITNLTNVVTIGSDRNMIIQVNILSGHPQCVGRLKGGALYSTIYQALNLLCPAGTGSCITDRETRFRVEYLDPYTALPKNDGLMHAWIENRGQSRQHSSEQMRRLLIGTIAGTVEASVHPDNCNQDMCNIPAFVSLVVSNNDNLVVRFQADWTNLAGFKCKSIIQQAGNKLNEIIDEYRSVLGDGDGRITCQVSPALPARSLNPPSKVVGNGIFTRSDNTTSLASTSQEIDDTQTSRISNTIVTLKVQPENPKGVGTLKGGALNEAVYDALLLLCPAAASTCDIGTQRTAFFLVEYLDANNKLKTSGKMFVGVRTSHHNSVQVRRLLIGSIAGTVQSQSYQGCDHANNANHDLVCNIASNIEVSTDMGDVMNVWFWADHEAFRNFVCNAILADTMQRTQDLMPEFRTALGIKGDLKAVCQDMGFDDTAGSAIGSVVSVSIRDGMGQELTRLKGPHLYDIIYRALSKLCLWGTADCTAFEAKPPNTPRAGYLSKWISQYRAKYQDGSHSLTGAVTLSIRNGMPQEVGGMNGSYIYGKVYEALLGLCPYGRSECDNDERRPPTTPPEGSHRYRLGPFKYLCTSQKRGRVFPCKDGWLTIWVEHGHHSTDQIRRLLIGSIAGTIEVATNNPDGTNSNCHKGGCKIPSFVGVETKQGDGLQVWFLTDYRRGGLPWSFDCSKIIGDVGKKLDALEPEWNSAVGAGTYAFCQT